MRRLMPPARYAASLAAALREAQGPAPARAVHWLIRHEGARAMLEYSRSR